MLKKKNALGFRKRWSYYAGKGNESPLNTNNFIMDRYQFEDKGNICDLGYGSISGEQTHLASRIH